GLEVRQQATQPPMIDVGHVGGFGRLLDGVASLLLGSDEQDRAAAPGYVGGEPARILQQLLGLQQVDDVDAVPLTEDEAAHLGVPAARLVAEVHAGLQQLPDSDLGHCSVLPCFVVETSARGTVFATSRCARQGATRILRGRRSEILEKSLRKYCRPGTFSGVAGDHPSPTSGDRSSRGPNLPSPTSGGSVRTFDGAALDGPPRRASGAPHYPASVSARP